MATLYQRPDLKDIIAGLISNAQNAAKPKDIIHCGKYCAWIWRVWALNTSYLHFLGCFFNCPPWRAFFWRVAGTIIEINLIVVPWEHYFDLFSGCALIAKLGWHLFDVLLPVIVMSRKDTRVKRSSWGRPTVRGSYKCLFPLQGQSTDILLRLHLFIHSTTLSILEQDGMRSIEVLLEIQIPGASASCGKVIAAMWSIEANGLLDQDLNEVALNT